MKHILMFSLLASLSAPSFSVENESDLEKTILFSSLFLIDHLEFTKKYCIKHATAEIDYDKSISHMKSIVDPKVLTLDRPQEYKDMTSKVFTSFEVEFLEVAKKKGHINEACSKFFENALRNTAESLRKTQQLKHKEYQEKSGK